MTVPGEPSQHADHRHRLLLRADSNRPAGSAAEQRDEMPPLHKILVRLGLQENLSTRFKVLIGITGSGRTMPITDGGRNDRNRR
jgi:hypothetical protein